MNEFLLYARPGAEIPGNLLDQLHSLSEVHVVRVKSGIVVAQFDGDRAALQALLAHTAWSQYSVSENRTYRTQAAHGGALATPHIEQEEPELREVLMQFAVEQRLPTAAHLHRYIEAFQRFRPELIEFAVSLVEDHFNAEPPDADQIG